MNNLPKEHGAVSELRTTESKRCSHFLCTRTLTATLRRVELHRITALVPDLSALTFAWLPCYILVLPSALLSHLSPAATGPNCMWHFQVL